MARWASLFRVQEQAVYATGKTQTWVYAVVTVLPATVSLTLFAVAGTVLADDISSGDFMAIVTALAQFGAAVVATSLTLGPALTIIPFWQRLLPILQEPLEEIGVRQPGRLSGELSLRSVTFAYDEDANVIEDISFDVRPGEFVAITGPSGAGKSTLLRLLLGLDQPTRGSVLLDGKDMRSLDTRAVRGQCGVVMQGARPLPGEILSAILGETGGSDDDAWAAAEGAGLADDIRKMPMQMHTIVGEGGLAFSEGQVQRLMIARALARRPKILFFDEATSALDDRVQAVVSSHIETLDATRVVIAHRLSTIRSADTIYVLEGGRITQSGSYDTLVASDGPFRRLAARQLL
jgi:ABC-type bacteriocin/lantibiotic exporter with double-glycine peptidase domain